MKLTSFLFAGLALGLAPVPLAFSDTLEPAWAVAPEGTPAPNPPTIPFMTYPWFTTANNIRGVAANPTNGHVLLGGPTKEIHVLDATGLELHALDVSTLSGGTLSLVQIGVADDGVVFATNLSATSPPASFRVYRWADDDPATVPTISFAGDPAAGSEVARWGDTFAVRGGGLNTLLVSGARAAGTICVFDTSDADDSDGVDFTPHIITGAGPASGMLGLAFGPNISDYDDPATPGTVEHLTLITVFTKLNGQAMRRTSIRTDTWAAVGTTTYNGTAPNPAPIASTITGIGTDPGGKWLGGIVVGTAGVSFLYDINSPNAVPSLVGQDASTLTANTNGNGIGAVDLFVASAGQTPGQNGIPLFPRLYTLNVNNTVMAFDIKPSVLPPSIVTHAANTTVIEGWKAIFSVTATGTTPLSYQWSRNDVEIPLATGTTYILDPVTTADADAVFKVVVTNPAGNAPSNPATLTVTPRVDTAVMTAGWKLAPGSRPYLDEQNLQRGLAHNPVGDHLLLTSRTPVAGLPNPAVIVLNAATGAEIPEGDVVRTLRLTDESDTRVVTGGTFPLSMIDCGDDGVVYGTNLAVVSEAPMFRIYRWSDDSAATVPTVAFSGDVFSSDRAGDCFKVRGAGVNTQLLVPARTLTKFAIFTTTDGENFTPTVFDVVTDPVLPNGSFFMTAFGAGNSIWTRAEGGGLRHIVFDLATTTATVAQSFTTTQLPGGGAPISVDPVKGLLGAINRNENPDNLRLFNVNDLDAGPELLDLEFFATDNANGNFAGTVDFGNGRIYALDTNNGLVTMNVNFNPAPLSPAVLTNLSYNGTVFSFTLQGESGKKYKIQGSPSLAAGSWTDDQTLTLAGTSQLLEITVPQGQAATFYRAITLP